MQVASVFVRQLLQFRQRTSSLGIVAKGRSIDQPIPVQFYKSLCCAYSDLSIMCFNYEKIMNFVVGMFLPFFTDKGTCQSFNSY